MAKKFGEVSVSEETNELEPETALEGPGGAAPARVERGGRSGVDGGGRRERSAGADFFARTLHFLRDVRAEMRRVSWPTASVVKSTTIITLIAVAFFAVYLFLVDQVWAYLILRLKTWLGG